MLKPLPCTDLLGCRPDVDGILLWSEDFKPAQLPSRSGCYAFYRVDSGEVVYIGSSATDGVDATCTGLRYRLRCYRDPKRPGTAVRIRTFNSDHSLAVRCWICEVAGDCLKYEVDAIRKHKPLLNTLGKIQRTAEEKRTIKRGRSNAYAAKPKPYDPNRVITCTRCKLPKKCSEFSASRRNKWGVKPRCRVCCRLDRAESKGTLTREQWTEALRASGKKRCYCCKQRKPFKDFGSLKRGILGLRNTCKACAHEQDKVRNEKRKEARRLKRLSAVKAAA